MRDVQGAFVSQSWTIVTLLSRSRSRESIKLPDWNTISPHKVRMIELREDVDLTLSGKPCDIV